MSAHRALHDIHKANSYFYIADPGNAGTIGAPKGVDRSPAYCGLVSAGAETRTLGRPVAAGDILTIAAGATIGGTITVTVTGGYDGAADTTFTITATGQWYTFISTLSGANLMWQMLSGYNLSGVTATAAEINAVADVSGRMINTTATQVTVDAATYGDRDLVVSSTHTTTLTLPAASGSGNRYSIIRGVSGTEGSTVVNVANTTDIFVGASIAQSTESTTIGFLATSTDNTITLNRTTTGGLAGTKIELVDIATGKFFVKLWNIGTGNPATPFSHT